MATQILLLEGMGITSSNWYSDELLRCGNFKKDQCTVTRVDFDHGRDPAMANCRSELRSGKYQAVIVCDLSTCHEAFEQHLGQPLCDFVRSGGRVAFPTSEGLLLVHTLKTLFDVDWCASSCSSATWDIHQRNASVLTTEIFPSIKNIASFRFTAKCTSFRNVPADERCFERVDQSRKKSAGKKQDEKDIEDCDVAVATKSYGRGRILFLGDVNCEEETSRLVHAFCMAVQPLDSAGSAAPFAAAQTSRLTAAAAHRQAGNEAFARQDFAAGLSAYDAALAALGGGNADAASTAEQDERVKVQSNRAQCLLSLERWAEARDAAAAALALDGGNAKALLRRAKALVELGDADAAAADLDALQHEHDVDVSTLHRRLRAVRREAQRGAGGAGDGAGGPFDPALGPFLDGDRRAVAPAAEFVDGQALGHLVRGPFMYCGHGLEACGLCAADHRLTNAFAMHPPARPWEAFQAEVMAALQRRVRAERDVVTQLATARRQPAIPGTAAHQRLYMEALRLHESRLPPWPPACIPPYRPAPSNATAARGGGDPAGGAANGSSGGGGSSSARGGVEAGQRPEVGRAGRGEIRAEVLDVEALVQQLNQTDGSSFDPAPAPYADGVCAHCGRTAADAAAAGRNGDCGGGGGGGRNGPRGGGGDDTAAEEGGEEGGEEGERGKRGGKLLRCGGCRSAASQECQAQAWAGHKGHCKALQAFGRRAGVARLRPCTWSDLEELEGGPATGRLLELRIGTPPMPAGLRSVFEGVDRKGAARRVACYAAQPPEGLRQGAVVRWAHPRYHCFLDGSCGARIEDSDLPNIIVTPQ